MRRINDPEVVARECAMLDRLAHRRLDQTGWLGREASEPIATMLAAVAEARPQRVLDVGCGTGELTALLTASHVVCVDLSLAAVGAASSRGLHALVADVQHLPVADGEFDVVLGNWILHHLPDLDQGVAEIARVLRPGGRFVGCGNRDDHLGELWSLVYPDFVQGDDYAEPLARRFARVQCRDTDGQVVWLTRADLQAFLDAYVELAGPMSAPEGPYPFVATRRNRVWIAQG